MNRMVDSNSGIVPDRNGDFVTLKAIGDIAFFPSIADKARKHGPIFIFEKVKKILNDADLIFGNFEFPFSKDGIPYFFHSYEGYRAELSMLPSLSAINFDVLNLANNHIMDWGAEGLETTKKALTDLGVRTIGAGCNLEKAKKPTVIERRGIKFGFLGYSKSGDWIATKTTPGATKLDIDLIGEDIGNLKRKVDHIIVSLHWGIEFSDYPYPNDIKIAHKLIDMGTRVILGHHPHVLQGYEEYNRGVIFYSLGNFVYDPFSERVFVKTVIEKRLENMVVEIRFSKKGIVSFSVIPSKINGDLQPVILGGKEKENLWNRIELLSDNITSKKVEFYQNALSNLFERELKTCRLLLKEDGLRFLWSRIKGFKFRYVNLLLGFLLSKIRSKIGLAKHGRR